MMRLQRVGRRNDPSYRIVVTDKRTGPKSNKHVALLGSYNPKQNHIQFDKESAKDWLSKGVQPSDTLHNLLVKEGVIEGKKINVLPRKSPIVDEEALKAEEEAKQAAVEAEKAEEEKGEETETAKATTDDTTKEAVTDGEKTEESTDEVEPEKETDKKEAEEKS